MFYVSKTSTTRMSDQIWYLTKIKMEDELGGEGCFCIEQIVVWLGFCFVKLIRAWFSGTKGK